jgi:drug/metabolite transporter (DMT)-like permease
MAAEPQRRSPLVDGAILAVLAAVSFGITTPIVARAGRGVGPLLTAALLYGGASASTAPLAWLWPTSGTRFERRDVGRLALIALTGAAIAPVLFAWGLQRVGATVGSLLLNLEAAFTVMLAKALYQERLGARVLAAVALMSVAGGVLAIERVRDDRWSALGVLAVAGATFAWALDNSFTRRLSERDPVSVVAAKGALGASVTAGLALVAFHETAPALGPALVLLACGATGYGLSLRLYLLAQRRIGVARTASVFAFAPFVGAVVAWPFERHAVGPLIGAAAVLFAIGIVLHLTERHGHFHAHERREHEHAHRHDDGHHDHAHDPPVLGEHTHLHLHLPTAHAHEHAPDVHHTHDHPRSAS